MYCLKGYKTSSSNHHLTLNGNGGTNANTDSEVVSNSTVGPVPKKKLVIFLPPQSESLNLLGIQLIDDNNQPSHFD
jgi:hypothetical protein